MSTKEQPSRLKKLMQDKKFQEIFWYFVFGVLTTIVNLITFGVLNRVFHVEWPVKIGSWDFNLFITFINAIAWVVAVVFAYVTNKLYVFHTKGNVMKEFIAFVVARLFTFFAFELGLFSLSVMVMENAMGRPQDDIFISIFGIGITNVFVVKLFVSFFVVVANYFFSKIFIFKKPKDAEASVKDGVSSDGKEEGSSES